MPLRAFLKSFIFLALLAVLLYFNLSRWGWPVLGWGIIILYFLSISGGGYAVLINFFNFSSRGFRTKILGWFLTLLAWGSLAGVFVVFYKLTALTISLAFLINGALFLSLKIWAAGTRQEPLPEMRNPALSVLDEMPAPLGGILLYLLLVALGFHLLWQSRSGEAVLSPWQVIHANYIFIFLAAVLLLGLFAFSSLKAKTILFFLFLLSLLLHSYLPLTHELLYGADGWRHIAVARQLIAEEPLTSVALSQPPLSFIHRLDAGRLAYSQFWAWQVGSSRVLGLDLLQVNIWLMPLLWSVIFPILLFEFGRALDWNKKESLFFAWLGLLPFAWQAGGSFNLPSNLGFLWWLLAVIMILKRMKQGRREQVLILAGAGILALFGYGLHFMLFWLAWIIAEAVNCKFLNSLPCRQAGHSRWRPLFEKTAWFLIFACSVFIIPLTELFAKYSFFNKNINWLGQIQQAVGNFTGFYLASGPRSHDIAAGNIIFNQIPAYAFVPNVLTEWRWWLVGFMTLMIILAAVGWVMSVRGKDKLYYWLAIMAASLWGGYMLCRYFMTGEHILARRLESVLALFLLAPAFYALRSFYNWAKFRHPRKMLSAAVVVFSLAITASYSLGPDTRAMSVDEYRAMEYIWNKEKGMGQTCVLSDTYPLLALEAISAKNVVGGGFPIDEYFAQPERVEIYERMLAYPQAEHWASALASTGASRCYLAAPRAKIKTNDYTEKNFANFRNFGKITVWEYNPSVKALNI